jgi:copper transport protein
MLLLLQLPCFLFLFQEAEEGLSAGEVLHELAGFLSYFAIFGTLGFVLLVLRRLPRGEAPVAEILAAAEGRAARIGLAGALLFLVLLAGFAFTNPRFQVNAGFVTQLVCGLVFLLCFALWRLRWTWGLAGLAGLVLALRNVTTGRWASLVNPLHEVAASLWIGTLFVLVVAGLPAVLRGPAGRRGALIAEMVARFSNLALAAASLLGVTGLITAWRHLKYPAALWTTSYGYAFDAKMLVVLTVLGLGAWNWRGMRPRLGTEEAAYALRRSATAELVFAGIVLVITAVLVSLPVPRLPGS